VGGRFATIGSQARDSIARLNAEGSLDNTFNPMASGGFPYPGLPYPFVDTLVVQDDGKILVGGQFATLGGEAHTSLGRSNSDGSVDTNFTAGVNGLFIR